MYFVNGPARDDLTRIPAIEDDPPAADGLDGIVCYFNVMNAPMPIPYPSVQ